jgi:homopolymeric O-antigen transport system ATP-binding protein
MSDIAIRCKGLGKQYHIGAREGFKTLRETITDVAASPIRLLRSAFNGSNIRPTNGSNTFWALKDLSFEIKRGEVVGIIGRNGAGKSTLLKILSRITTPTTGEVEIRGQVGSLLEVGTGFHPELTGRENIFLNGAILGMKRVEIARKFDEIVAFAEIEKFIDTPVKRYSSGMYVRLAFAVAAHLEPDILLVDEVLAVGDAAFQKKCLGKMGSAAKEGRTVLFVSHNMAAVQSLCDVGIVLVNGKVETMKPIGEAIHFYQNSLGHINNDTLKNIRGVQVITVRAIPGAGATRFTSDNSLIAEFNFYTEHYLPKCYLNLVIEDAEGRSLVHSRTDLHNLWPSFNSGVHCVRVETSRLSLRAGIYTLWFRLYVSTGGITEMADSERIMLEVDGPQIGGLVDVPWSWSWESVSQ